MLGIYKSLLIVGKICNKSSFKHCCSPPSVHFYKIHPGFKCFGLFIILPTIENKD
jgi:hypothetical protein